MDRVIVYPGALPQTVDQLYTNKFALVGQAYQNRAILGINTVVSGLACLPTSPTPDLHVSVGVGSIYQIDPTDQAAYGDLGTDSINIMKQGILNTAATLTITPPGTVGFSQVFLVQAILNDVDAGSLVLSYYNSANPSAPYSGPANSGTSNFTTRTCPCVIALKAGTAASTGTQTTPTADAGYVGLYAITVANGQTQINSNNIAQLPSAPFFPTLPAVPASVQNGSWVYVGTDTGGVNAYVISFVAGQPIPAAYVAGMAIKFKALVTNTGASVINVNGLGNVTIRRANGAGLAANDITSGQIVELSYDGTFFQMTNYLGSGANTNTNTLANIPYVADTDSQNALIGTYSPVITSGQQVAGLALAIKLANAITGTCTINVNGLGLKSVTLGDLTTPPYNAFTAGMVLVLEYDGTQYQIINTSSGMFYRQPTANYTIYVNTGTGSDTLYNGFSASIVGNSGPFKTIGKAVATAFLFAPSQFTITISVAAGTYNESVQTPFWAGPNLVIDGGSAASVTVNGGSSGSAFQVGGPNTLTVKNVTVQTTSGVLNGFSAINGSTLITLNTASNGVSGYVFGASSGANISPGAHTFNGSAGYALFLGNTGGSINPGSTTIYTVSTAISCGVATAQTIANGIINMPITAPVVFVNPSFISAVKYNASANGVIYGAVQFPGTIAGITSSGGQAV